jgi:hypothetical protein
MIYQRKVFPAPLLATVVFFGMTAQYYGVFTVNASLSNSLASKDATAHSLSFLISQILELLEEVLLFFG